VAAGVSGLMPANKIPEDVRLYVLHLVSLGVPRMAVGRRYGVADSSIVGWQRVAAKPRYTQCSVCGEWIVHRTYGGGKRRKYCEGECQRLMKAKVSQDHRDGKIDPLCQWCLVRSKASNRQVCSDDCYRQKTNHGLAHGPDLWCVLPLCCVCGLVKGINHAAGQCRDCLATYNRRVHLEAKLRGKGKKREAAYRDGDPITIGGVIARVGRRCHLCKKLARLDVDWLDPLAAQVDHLIPISKGGTHTWDNVAIAHRLCNVKKGNKAVGDQLRLLTVGGV